MKALLTAFFALSCFFCFSQPVPELPQPDKIRIREGMRIAELYSGKLFKGFDKTPFAIVLVTDSIEYLINHPRPSNDFIALGFDSLLLGPVYYRKRIFGKQLLATFPAVGGLPCVVIGTPANTGKNSSEWVTTLLHEHFHQYQSSDPGYYQGVDSLDLAGGDQSGMWMLNFPFPYDSVPVVQQYERYAAALAAVVSADENSFTNKLADYRKERNAFTQMLSAKDERYFSFQLWQEGLARHTEYALLRSILNYRPSPVFIALPDYQPFAIVAEQLYKREMGNLTSQKLQANKRISFYSIGFAEGQLLDRLKGEWRERYFIDRFRLPQL